MNGQQYSRIKALSGLLSLQLGHGPVRQDTEINDDLVSYAIKRHRVGPMLFRALEQVGAVETPQLLLLEASYKRNVQAVLAQRATSRNLANLLESEAIPFTFLKGYGLARQLYADPSVRLSNDIDVLVPKTAARSALRLLNENGYAHKPTTTRDRKSYALARQVSDMERFKDQTFVDSKFSTVVELHERLFKMEPNDLTSNFNEAVGFERYPSINETHYCLYFVLHGALTFWSRLKWVADLSLLAGKISSNARVELFELANEYGCAPAIAASFRLVEDIFPGSLDDEWKSILETHSQDRLVNKITRISLKILSSSRRAEPYSMPRRPVLSDAYLLIFGGKVGMLNVIRSRVLDSIAMRV